MRADLFPSPPPWIPPRRHPECRRLAHGAIRGPNASLPLGTPLTGNECDMAPNAVGAFPRCLSLGILILAGDPTGALAQGTTERVLTPLPIDSLLSARTLGEYSQPTFSLNGNWIAYTVREHGPRSTVRATADLTERTGIPWYALGARIVLVDTAANETRPLPAGDGESWLPKWSPRGRSVAFLSSRTPTGGGPRAARLWVWDLDANRVRLVSRRMVRPGPLVWSGDGRRGLLQLAASVEGAARATQ